jgi:hypothetical protein
VAVCLQRSLPAAMELQHCRGVFGHQGYLNPYWVLSIPQSGRGGQYVAVGNADDHRLASVWQICRFRR